MSSEPLPASPAPVPAGPDERVARLVRRHQRAVGAYLDSLGCPEELVEDFVQETFVAALGLGWPGTGEDPSRAWLRSVAKNRFLDHLRRDRSAPEVAVDDVDAAWRRFDGDDEGASYLEALRSCIAALAERERRALDLRYRDRLDRAELGAALGLSVGGVKSVLAKAKAALRICIERKLA